MRRGWALALAAALAVGLGTGIAWLGTSGSALPGKTETVVQQTTRLRTETAAGPLPRPRVALPDGPAFTAFENRVEVTNSDGTWTVWWTFDPHSSLAPGAVSRFVPRGQTEPLVDDAGPEGTINDPRFGGLGAFGWHHARRDGCCDTAPQNFASVDGPGGFDIDANHAWGIDSRRRSPFGVSAISHTRPARNGQGDVVFEVTLDYSDGWHNPVLTTTYRYEFYDGTGPLGGGVRVWTDVVERCGEICRDAGGAGFSRVFVKEPKIVAVIAPGADGAITYSHATVFDDSATPKAIAQCNIGNLPDPDRSGSSCAVRQALLERGASRIRFDDGLAGCPGRECFHASFRAYRGNGAALTTPSLRWSTPGAGLDGWAAASNERRCFGLWGGGGTRAQSCDPPVDATTTGDTGGGCVNVADAPGVPRQWELHRRGGWAQALVPGWTGGHGGYDCPLASRAFGPDGETWSLYANYSYGPGWDLHMDP